MIRVHHLNHSQSMRVLWLLEELSLPYEIIPYKRGRTKQAPNELKRIHPLGKSPVIEVDGHVIAETGAIAELLIEKAGGKLGPPADEEGRRHYRYFFHYSQGSVMPAVMVAMLAGLVPVIGGLLRKAVQSFPGTHLDFLDAELAKRPWLAGDDFTAADVMMGFPIELAKATFGDLGNRPHLTAWLTKALDRPAYRAAREKGGDYNLKF